MKSYGPGQLRADLISAWAIASGIGLIVLMVTWLVGNRLFGLLLAPPRGPTVAFGVAVALGFVTAAVAGKRLVATVVIKPAQPDHDGLGDSSVPAPT